MIRTNSAKSCGTYGIVYSAKMSAKDDTEIVVKRNVIDSSISFSGSIRELDLLNRLRGHPYIVKLLAVSLGSPFAVPNSPIADRKDNCREDYLHFVFEKGDYNLHKLIHEKEIHVSYMKLAMVQTLLGLEYMHAKGVMHRDIKPANLLWFLSDNKPTVKFCDFGLSKIKTQQEPSSPGVVTCWYRAPEICAADPTYSYNSDIWSLGCVFYEMISKSALLIGQKDDNNKILRRIIEILPNVKEEDIIQITAGNAELNLIKDKSNRSKKSWQDRINLSEKDIEEFNKYSSSYDSYLDLLDKMLQLNHEKRISASEALNHPFFEPYTNIIEWSRSVYPPTLKTEPLIEVMDCLERRWATKLAFVVFNGREPLHWYKHRILFQSIDMFDRYLCYLRDNTKELLTESSLSGKYMTRYTTQLRYMVCLYMSIKYFNTLTAPISFTEIANDEYKTKKALTEAEEFEQKLLKDILKFKVYRETLYESADRSNIKLEEIQVRDLLLAYGTTSSKNTSPSALLAELLK